MYCYELGYTVHDAKKGDEEASKSLRCDAIFAVGIFLISRRYGLYRYFSVLRFAVIVFVVAVRPGFS